MIKADEAYDIFLQSVLDYHRFNELEPDCCPPYDDELKNLLYAKNWIDTIQWHLEDEIRSPNIPAEEVVQLKRKIDSRNQERTNIVEKLDDYFFTLFSTKTLKPDARLNTETPAWALDRLSILALKIYHMNQEYNRVDEGTPFKRKLSDNVQILKEQKMDLCSSIDSLLVDLNTGNKKMKLYRQMKMYNDEQLNPVLRKNNA